jgi:hypothetical protein
VHCPQSVEQKLALAPADARAKIVPNRLFQPTCRYVRTTDWKAIYQIRPQKKSPGMDEGEPGLSLP